MISKPPDSLPFELSNDIRISCQNCAEAKISESDFRSRFSHRINLLHF